MAMTILTTIVAIVSLSVALTPLMVQYAEPYVNWADMQGMVWANILFWSLLCGPLVSVWCVVLYRLDRKYSGAEIAWERLKLRSIRIYLSSLILVIFGVGQIVFAARYRGNLMEGVPPHLMSSWFDIMASYLWLALLVAVWLPWRDWLLSKDRDAGKAEPG
jgi:hypothetical protein